MARRVVGFHLADEDEVHLQEITRTLGWTRSQVISYLLSKATIDGRPEVSIAPLGATDTA